MALGRDVSFVKIVRTTNGVTDYFAKLGVTDLFSSIFPPLSSEDFLRFLYVLFSCLFLLSSSCLGLVLLDPFSLFFFLYSFLLIYLSLLPLKKKCLVGKKLLKICRFGANKDPCRSKSHGIWMPPPPFFFCWVTTSHFFL